jgi:hypothetical protein
MRTAVLKAVHLKLHAFRDAGQPVVPHIAIAFIFMVKHFFLDYLTLTMKPLHTIKMTGTVTSPKDLNLFGNDFFDLATVIYVIIYGPLLNPPGFTHTTANLNSMSHSTGATAFFS